MRPRARLNEKTMADRARKKERKIAFTAFTGFSPPPPSRDFARCGGKGHSNSRLLSRWALAWLLTTPPNGELARGLPVTVNSYGKKYNKIFNFQRILEGSLFSTTPLPQSETKNPFRVTWKRLEKVITTWNACVRKNKNFNCQHILPLLFLQVVASFLDF